METYNVTGARANLYKLVDQVNEDHTPIQIQGKRGDAVLISAEDWASIEETLYIMSVPGLAEDIIKSFEEPIETMEYADEVEW
ncbi:MAG TPA: type II toxin-antitoxin system Phd/YefM family antitoxin [Anaerovoracaceae bacterium]|nr:type II toxin-antitoxin system Phd/YefM family antitoxin [Anaerovoracaceae bacterium]